MRTFHFPLGFITWYSGLYMQQVQLLRLADGVLEQESGLVLQSQEFK